MGKNNGLRKNRQAEAEERNEERSKRTAEQQLKRLDQGGHKATKERARLGVDIDEVVHRIAISNFLAR